MTETGVSNRVANVAVRVVQSDFERVFTSCLAMGELRTYNGSRYIITKISHRPIVNIH